MKMFPKLPFAIKRQSTLLSTMLGINLTDNAIEGELADCNGLSFRRFPYMATRADRVRQNGLDNASTLTVCNMDKLVAVINEHLYYNGTDCGALQSGGAKQFAAVNTKLVIWPDKMYLDLNELTLHSLEASAHGTGAVFTASAIEVSWTDTDFTELFFPGDVVFISDAETAENNISAMILSVAEKTLTFTDNVFTPATETVTITIARKVPNLDYITEHDNRLWGCCNADRTIYASALGDPKNFYASPALTTGSYSVAVTSSGVFTGCCALGSSVLVWKDHQLLKILGDNPTEFRMYSYDIEGLREGCYKSLQIINDTLIYVGTNGVYAFGGERPTLLSPEFTGYELDNAVAGTDGQNYFISAKHGNKWNLWVYNTKYGKWIREDKLKVYDFARVNNTVFFLADNIDTATGTLTSVFLEKYYSAGTCDWYAQYVPFYGAPQKKLNYQSVQQSVKGKKQYSDMLIRFELADSAYLQAEVRYDGGRWYRVGAVGGAEHDTALGKANGVTSGVRAMRIVLDRCDKLELKLSGHGECTVLSVTLNYRTGSEK